MAKIPVSTLLSDFRRMAQENWSYVAGGSSTGQVDCSGAFVWAFRQHGCSIYHGSNRIARTEVLDLTPIDRATVIPGMVAFKCRQPGLFSGYALPDDYKTNGDHYNGDLGDYYHIGLVSDNPKQVLNAQSSQTGFVSSSISKGWTHVGYLKQVDYGVDQPAVSDTPASSSPQQSTTPVTPAVTATTATVVAQSGSTVNLRKKADKHSDLVERVPVGATVDVTGSKSGEWYPVKWGKWSGYMMGEFLSFPVSGGSGMPAETSPVDVGPSWAVTIYDLTKTEAEALKARYPSSNMFETVG